MHPNPRRLWGRPSRVRRPGIYDDELFECSEGSLHARGKIEVRHGKPACLDGLTVPTRRVVPTGGVE